MPVTVINEGESVTALLKGDLDHHSVMQIRREIDSALSIAMPQVVFLDFSEVGFMDSSGIGLILGRMKAAEGFGGRVVIKNTNPYTAKMIRLGGLGSLILEGGKKKERRS